jgi:hypothetical protein
LSSTFGSRRGKPLLPLGLQWVVFILCAALSATALFSWITGRPDTYPHEHSRLALLAVGITCMAAAGLVRRNRSVHVALFAAGGACLIIGALIRFVG